MVSEGIKHLFIWLYAHTMAYVHMLLGCKGGRLCFSSSVCVSKTATTFVWSSLCFTFFPQKNPASSSDSPPGLSRGRLSEDLLSSTWNFIGKQIFLRCSLWALRCFTSSEKMKTWENSQYVLFSKGKKKKTPRVLLKNINPHQHIFCILTMSYYFFIQKLTQIFELLYQKKTSRVKATEEPEQNSTCVCSTCASKVSWHRGSAQDACHTSVLGCQVLTYTATCLSATAPKATKDQAMSLVIMRRMNSLSPSAPHTLGQGDKQVAKWRSIQSRFAIQKEKICNGELLNFFKAFLFLQTHFHWYFLHNFRTWDTSSQPLGLQRKNEDYWNHFKCPAL